MTASGAKPEAGDVQDELPLSADSSHRPAADGRAGVQAGKPQQPGEPFKGLGQFDREGTHETTIVLISGYDVGKIRWDPRAGRAHNDDATDLF